MYKAFDLFAFDDDLRDWSAEFLLYKGVKEKDEKPCKLQQAQQKKGTRPSLRLESYVGKYQDVFDDPVEVKSVDGN